MFENLSWFAATIAFSLSVALPASAQNTDAQELLSGDIEILDEYGFSIAVDGEWLAVGAVADDRLSLNNVGSVSMFRNIDGVWTFSTKIVPSDFATSKRFGHSVDIEGTRMIVGATGDSETQFFSGAIYVFEFIAGFWSQTDKIKSTGSQQDLGGYDVALSGDTILDGVPFAEVSGLTNFSGRAFVHVYNGSDWLLQSALDPNDIASGDEFGTSVALEGDVAVIGAPAKNAAYVFRRNGTSWSQEAKLTAPSSAAGDSYGFDVALHGDRIAVGAPFENLTNLMTGGVYTFRLANGNWAFQERLISGDAIPGQEFGSSLSMVQDRLYIGARNDSSSFGNAGAAYAFNSLSGGWLQTEKFTSADLATADFFGYSIDSDEENFVVGARLDSTSAMNGGSAYAWDQTCFGFTEIAPATYEVCLGLQRTDTAQSVFLPRFDPMLGALNGIRFTLKSHFEGDVAYENLSATSATVDFSIAREISVRRPDGSVIVSEFNTVQQQATLGPFDGALDFAGASSALITNLVSDVTTPVTIPMPAPDLDLFTGPIGDSGLVHLGIDATALVTKMLPANIARSAVNSLVSAELTVEYVFDPTGRPFCFGDGADAMNCTPCPCGNDSPPGTIGGCLNSAGMSALLQAAGTPSISGDTLTLAASRATPGVFALLISGQAALPADGSCTPETGIQSNILVGLRCVGAGIMRHGTRGFDNQGASILPWGAPGQSIAQLNAFVAGQTRYFQVLYRETSGVVCTIDQLLNSTNGVEVTFIP